MNSGLFEIKEHIVFKSRKPKGILCPGTIFSFTNKQLLIHGKKFDAIINKPYTSEDIWLGLEKTSSILKGNSHQCEMVNSWLNSPAYSRTVSYLTILFNNCNDLIRAFESFRSSHIVIFGCGGIGSLTAVSLAGMGIGKITLLDGDFIEKSNLNRQLFFTKRDIGKSKVEVLKREILKRFENVTVKIIKEFTSEEIINTHLQKCTVALVTADDPMNLYYTAIAYAKKRKIPLLSCGYFMDRARITILGSKNTIKENQTYFKLPNAIAPSYGPTNMELAGLVSSLLLQVISKNINTSDQIFLNWSTTEFPRKTIQVWK